MPKLSVRHVTRLWAIFVLFIVAGIQPIHAMPCAETDLPAVIDPYITGQMQALKIPGVALAVVRGDQIAYVQGYGVADSTGRPVTPQTPFLLASISKSFTALGLMQLAEAGQLDLDAPVQRYLPWFQVADADASARLTLRHLLYHTSGLSEVGGYERNLDENVTDEALEQSVRGLNTARLNNPPGSVYEYSNTNYDILGLVIQTVSGQSYEAYVRQHIFTPLEMRHAFTSLAEARVNGLASGYYPFFGFPVVYDAFIPYGRTTVPSAGLAASAEDMAHYLMAHLNEGASRGQHVVSPAGMAKIHTPGVTIEGEIRYAMGWVTFPFRDIAPEAATSDAVPRGYSHAGIWAGFTSLAVLVPERDLGVVVLMNTHDSLQPSAFFNLGWNTAILALGLQATDRPPQEEVVTRNGRVIGIGLLVLLVLVNFWQARSVRRWRVQWASHVQRQRILVWVMLPLMAEVALAFYVWVIRILGNNNTLPLIMRFEPDLGLIAITLLVQTLGWGPLRTGLLLRALLKKPVEFRDRSSQMAPM